MNKAKTLMVCSVLAASAGFAQVAQAESPLTANIGIASNYIFRGVSQNDDQAAVQGGVDYTHDSGFYAGTWISNLASGTNSLYGYGDAGNYEQDWYAGYGFKTGSVDLDVGYILYTYPVGIKELDYGEVYVNAGWQMLTGGIFYNINKEDGTAKKGDIYTYVGTEFEVKKDLTLGLVLGRYDFRGGSTADYTHFQISLSKNDFTIAFDKNNAKSAGWYNGVDDYRFTVSWGMDLDL